MVHFSVKKSKKKASLKAALSSTQARLEKKRKAKDAATQALNQRAKGTSGKGMTKAKNPRRSTIPFNALDNILLIGEGNFSFAVALLLHPPASLDYLPPANVVATAYDTEEECYTKYPDAEQNVRLLREKGAQTSALKGRVFDRVVWNFPHAGKGITDQDRNILSNQVLILGFLRSAARFLVRGPMPQLQPSGKGKHSPNDDEDEYSDEDHNEVVGISGRARGTVLITLRNVPPYTEWDVPKLAKNPPPPHSSTGLPNPQYILFRSFVFYRSDWRGYEHRMTKGERAHVMGRPGKGGRIGHGSFI
ncbi:hypothetical protein BC826DRAFT_1089165 [Russula brevipes]|nr:hypothetical protein BC826DRAFT_1089165 [Russula brevipes]